MAKTLRQNTIFDGYIDLSLHSLMNAVAHPLSTAAINALPSPVEGQLAMDSTLHLLKFYNGSSWVALGSGSGNVTGPGPSVVNNELVVFSGTGGLTIGRSNGLSYGAVKLASGIMSAATLNDVATATANYGLGGFKLTGVGTGTSATDAATLTNRLSDFTTAPNASVPLGAQKITGLGLGVAATDAASLTNKITDFVTAPTSALALGAQKITGLGLATAGTDAASLNNKVTDFAAATGAVTSLFSGRTVTIGDGVAASDAVSKQQLDAVSAGVFYKQAVKGASTANLTVASALINGLSHDGVTYATGDRILLKDQTSHAEDGIYVIVASGAASRATDADVLAEMQTGATVFVDTGTAGGNTQWTQTNLLATLGTTAMAWVKTFQAADLTGAGVPKKYSALTSTMNGTLGLVLGTPGSGTGAIIITHNLGLAVPAAFTWHLNNVTGLAQEECEMAVNDGNSFYIWGWATAPAANSYRVTVIG